MNLFGPLPLRAYRVIIIDPPWKFKAGTKGRPQHYERMTDREMAMLPIKDLAHPEGAWVFCWCTSPLAPRMFEIAKAWGCNYSARGFVWIKTLRSDGETLFHYRDGFHTGMGYTTRKNAEDCWLFKFGKPKRQNNAVRELIISPLREHSRKPDEAYERIRQFADGPYCELFAREQRSGFDAWGDEIDRFDDDRPITNPPRTVHRGTAQVHPGIDGGFGGLPTERS
jgi:N6-adenosine-specific RNA methylase IME4